MINASVAHGTAVRLPDDISTSISGDSMSSDGVGGSHQSRRKFRQAGERRKYSPNPIGYLSRSTLESVERVQGSCALHLRSISNSCCDATVDSAATTQSSSDSSGLLSQWADSPNSTHMIDSYALSHLKVHEMPRAAPTATASASTAPSWDRPTTAAAKPSTTADRYRASRERRSSPPLAVRADSGDEDGVESEESAGEALEGPSNLEALCLALSVGASSDGPSSAHTSELDRIDSASNLLESKLSPQAATPTPAPAPGKSGVDHALSINPVQEANLRPTAIKILLLGDSEVGKTSLLRRLVDDEFSTELARTAGVDFKVKILAGAAPGGTGAVKYRCQLWDTGSYRTCAEITRTYFKSAHAIILVFDLTNRGSFDQVAQLVADVRADSAVHVPLIIVGNKSDLIAERRVSNEEAQAAAAQYPEVVLYAEVSSRTGDGVAELLQQVANHVIAHPSCASQESPPLAATLPHHHPVSEGAEGSQSVPSPQVTLEGSEMGVPGGSAAREHLNADSEVVDDAQDVLAITPATASCVVLRRDVPTGSAAYLPAAPSCDDHDMDVSSYDDGDEWQVDDKVFSPEGLLQHSFDPILGRGTFSADSESKPRGLPPRPSSSIGYRMSGSRWARPGSKDERGRRDGSNGEMSRTGDRAHGRNSRGNFDTSQGPRELRSGAQALKPTPRSTAPSLLPSCALS